MREIKFRGKRIDNGEWVCGYGAIVGEHYGRVHDEEREASIFVEYDKVSKLNFQLVNVDPQTVGQYTLLNDRNVDEIFENDIVEEVQWETGRKYKVVWRFDGWHLDNENGDEYDNGDYYHGYDVTWEYFKVIGNIHDNPELLKEN